MGVADLFGGTKNTHTNTSSQSNRNGLFGGSQSTRDLTQLAGQIGQAIDGQAGKQEGQLIGNAVASVASDVLTAIGGIFGGTKNGGFNNQQQQYPQQQPGPTYNYYSYPTQQQPQNPYADTRSGTDLGAPLNPYAGSDS